MKIVCERPGCGFEFRLSITNLKRCNNTPHCPKCGEYCDEWLEDAEEYDAEMESKYGGLNND